MKRVIRPIPKNEEIQLNPYKTIMSKTDKKGIIEYANDYFMKISGYKEWELMGQPHSILRHPDMPKFVFKLLWDNLNRAKPIYAIVKNLAKDGRFYWVIADFKTKIDSQGNITHYARRKAVPKAAKAKIEKVYQSILEIEKVAGLDASKVYFQGLLEDAGVDYNTFIHNLMDLSPEQLHDYMSSEINDDSFIGDNGYSAEEAIKTTTKKKGLFGKLFG